MSKNTIYMVALLFLQWIALFLLAMAPKPLYTLIFVPLLVLIFLYYSRKSKLLLALCCVSLYLAYVALFQEMPKSIRYIKCFGSAISFPANKEQQQCLNALTYKDYVEVLFKL